MHSAKLSPKEMEARRAIDSPENRRDADRELMRFIGAYILAIYGAFGAQAYQEGLMERKQEAEAAARANSATKIVETAEDQHGYEAQDGDKTSLTEAVYYSDNPDVLVLPGEDSVDTAGASDSTSVDEFLHSDDYGQTAETGDYVNTDVAQGGTPTISPGKTRYYYARVPERVQEKGKPTKFSDETRRYVYHEESTEREPDEQQADIERQGLIAARFGSRLDLHKIPGGKVLEWEQKALQYPGAVIHGQEEPFSEHTGIRKTPTPFKDGLLGLADDE